MNRVGVYSTQLKEGTYWVYVLCQVAAMSNVEPVWDRVGMNSGTANWVAVIKSAVLPGLGQMGKDHFTEGLFTLLGEGALVGGGIACYNIAQNQLKIMTPTANANDYHEASRKYSTYCQSNPCLQGSTQKQLRPDFSALLYYHPILCFSLCRYNFKILMPCDVFS